MRERRALLPCSTECSLLLLLRPVPRLPPQHPPLNFDVANVVPLSLAHARVRGEVVSDEDPALVAKAPLAPTLHPLVNVLASVAELANDHRVELEFVHVCVSRSLQLLLQVFERIALDLKPALIGRPHHLPRPCRARAFHVPLQRLAAAKEKALVHVDLGLDLRALCCWEGRQSE